MTQSHSMLTSTLLATLLAAPAVAADAQQPDSRSDTHPTRVVIYPILVQAPIFGASVDLPALPGGGGGIGGGDESADVSGSTDVKLNAAYLAGFLVQTNRFFVEGAGTWADISAERTSPRVRLATETLLFTGRAGVRFYKGFSATGGVHRLTSDMDATLTPSRGDRTIEGHTKPGFWDPMVGLDWRESHGRWDLNASFEGGGFGVGTDVDVTGEFRADYRMGWFDVRLGYQFVHYKMTVANVQIGQYSRELISTQTLHGPSLGLGIAF